MHSAADMIPGSSLQDGNQHTCDVLVIADGVNSKVRSALLPDAKPYYAGIITVAVRACHSSSSAPCSPAWAHAQS